MPGLVLNFGEQDHLFAQAVGEGNPDAFWQLSNNLAVGELRDHANELAASFGRHPIAWLDFFAARYECFESGIQLVCAKD